MERRANRRNIFAVSSDVVKSFTNRCLRRSFYRLSQSQEFNAEEFNNNLNRYIAHWTLRLAMRERMKLKDITE